MDSTNLAPIFLAGSITAILSIAAVHYVTMYMRLRLPILWRYVLGSLILLAGFLAASWVGDLLELRLPGWQWVTVLAVVIVAAGATTFLCHGVDAYMDTHHRAAAAEDKAAMYRGALGDGE